MHIQIFARNLLFWGQWINHYISPRIYSVIKVTNSKYFAAIFQSRSRLKYYPTINLINSDVKPNPQRAVAGQWPRLAVWSKCPASTRGRRAGARSAPACPRASIRARASSCGKAPGCGCGARARPRATNVKSLRTWPPPSTHQLCKVRVYCHKNY